jgi:spermidine synthase
LFALRRPARHVLIIGGGDCGVAREVLRHQSVERVTMAEIDRMVCDLCREHMPAVCEGVYEDPRFKLIIGDGAEVIRRMKGQCDVIIIDSTDPIGPAKSLFNTDFYQSVYEALADGGITIHQTGALILQPFEAPGSWRQIERSFDDVRVVQFSNISYMGGPFSLTAGSKGKGVFKNTERNALRAYNKAGFRTAWYSPLISAVPYPEFQKRRHGHRAPRPGESRCQEGGEMGAADMRRHQDDFVRRAHSGRCRVGRRGDPGTVRGDQRHQLSALRSAGRPELLHLRPFADGGSRQVRDRFLQGRERLVLVSAARLLL